MYVLAYIYIMHMYVHMYVCICMCLHICILTFTVSAQDILSGGCRIVSSETQFKLLDVKLKLPFPEKAPSTEVCTYMCT